MNIKTPPSPMDVEILLRLRRLIRAVAIYASDTRKRTGLSASQVACLDELSKEGSLSFGNLSERVHLSPSSITKIMDRLESMGLVHRIRNENDRRVIQAQITPKGTTLMASMPKSLQKSMLEGLGALPQNTKTNINEGLTELARLMNVQDLPSTPLLETAEELLGEHQT